MKRLFDIIMAFFIILLMFAPLMLIIIAILLTSKGPVLYWSKRVGKRGVIFKMPKFRSMTVGAPEIASHLMIDPAKYLSPIGGFLRRSSVDELPQLWSIIIGDMSFVGPRPALFNQYDLIDLRQKHGVDTLTPGVTGLAQIMGRDRLSIEEKVNFEIEYLNNKNFWLDVKLMWLTLFRIFNDKNISH
jgi:O-antigen biosynthesis protein WbqP